MDSELFVFYVAAAAFGLVSWALGQIMMYAGMLSPDLDAASAFSAGMETAALIFVGLIAVVRFFNSVVSFDENP
ncbi:hypothetical protein HNP46_000511 [Pseudomonas nitritireducens]|uniref:Uncharacterized protein n=1 Tax=Pseudomonas nitroreducens TaxID=46680 RepID=A0A7W7KF49_PSENT|nr:hypothetical protein [Pseudomonas nitritireducens]MBB4861700.1 hypothetical protein [Pseudomonas nitritireducens]